MTFTDDASSLVCACYLLTVIVSLQYIWYIKNSTTV